MSDDGAHALTVIAMLGNPFSPRYAKARARRGAEVDPLDFSVFNVALRGPAAAWSCTERGRGAIDRSSCAVAIGASQLEVVGSGFVADIDERTAPWGRRVRGRVRLTPTRGPSDEIVLDRGGAHAWRTLAATADAEVELTEPRLRFRGRGYLDANAGASPLERAFTGWTWARSIEPGRTRVSYDVERRDGSRLILGRVFEPRSSRALPRLERHRLGTSRWGVETSVAADAGSSAWIERRLEDTPFYARSLVSAELDGARVRCVHEALSLRRLERQWVQFLLPFKMRREP